MYREQKFHNTELLCGKTLSDACPTTGRTLRFNPVAYFATAATTSSKDIFHGFPQFMEFPQSMEDLLQCSGRCGHSPTATFHMSSFTMVVSLNSLVSLMTRIFIIPNVDAAKKSVNHQETKGSSQSTSTNQSNKQPALSSSLLSFDALAQRQWTRTREVLSLICLDDGCCVQQALKQVMLHPHRPPVCDLAPTCGGACWRCKYPRISTPFDAPINLSALQGYLIRMFITEKLPPSRMSLHKDCFVDKLLAFP